MDSSPLIRSHTTDGNNIAGEFSVLELTARPRGEMPLEEKAAFRLILEWAKLCSMDLVAEFREELEDFLAAIGPLGDQYKTWADDIRRACGIDVRYITYI